LIIQRLVIRDRQRQIHSIQVDIVVVVGRHARIRRRQLAKVLIFLQTDHHCCGANDEERDMGHHTTVLNSFSVQTETETKDTIKRV